MIEMQVLVDGKIISKEDGTEFVINVKVDGEIKKVKIEPKSDSCIVAFTSR
ncbi:MAG: hypothetical protein AB1604_03565 [Euryarchaeota archaeon]